MAAPILAPAGPLVVDGLILPVVFGDDFAPREQIVTADQPVGEWFATGGEVTILSATQVRWIVPNRTGNWNLTAMNGAEVGILQTLVRGIVPNYWALKTPVEAKKDVQVFKPKRGPKQFRSFDEMMLGWDLKNDDSDLERGLEMRSFWNWHHPGKEFDLFDVVTWERRRYQIDSNMSYFYETTGGMSWGFRIEEAYPYVVINA
jgi:hypothetical protein